MGRIYIDKYTGRLERTDVYRVRLIMRNGSVFEDLEPRRLFPMTNTSMYITLLDADEHEIGFIRDFEELDPDSKRVLNECFAEFYMIPKITHLLDYEDNYGTLKWHVMTDRGEITFHIRSRHSDIKQFYGTRRVLIRDANDNRYEIPDLDALDLHSQKLLFAFL